MTQISQKTTEISFKVVPSCLLIQNEYCDATTRKDDALVCTSIDELRRKFLGHKLLLQHDDNQLSSSKSEELQKKLLFLDVFLDAKRYNSIHKVRLRKFQRVRDVLGALDFYAHRVMNLGSLRDEHKSSLHDVECFPHLCELVDRIGEDVTISHRNLSSLMEEQAMLCGNEVYLDSDLDTVEHVTTVHDEKHLFSHNFTPPEPPRKFQQQIEKLLNDVTTVCHSFFLEVNDWFHLYQRHDERFVSGWIGNNRTVLLSNEWTQRMIHDDCKMVEYGMEQFHFSDNEFMEQQLSAKEWSFMDHLNEYTTDWKLGTHTTEYTFDNDDEEINREKTQQSNLVSTWVSDCNYSNFKGMKLIKFIGYVDSSIEEVSKAMHCDDNEVGFLFDNIRWNEYNKRTTEQDDQSQSMAVVNNSEMDLSMFIDSTNTYPSCNLTSVFNFGPIFKKRTVSLVLGSMSHFKSHVHQQEMFKTSMVYRSYDYLDSKTNKQLSANGFRMYMIGGRTFYKMDSNRTRYSEVRFVHLGGTLNSNIINRIIWKKLQKDSYQSVVKSLERQRGKPFPSYDENYLTKVWVDSCRFLKNVDLNQYYSTNTH